MNEITILEHKDSRIELRINGKSSDLMAMLASAISNDPNFGLLVIGAMTLISEQQSNFPDINPN